MEQPSNMNDAKQTITANLQRLTSLSDFILPGEEVPNITEIISSNTLTSLPPPLVPPNASSAPKKYLLQRTISQNDATEKMAATKMGLNGPMNGLGEDGTSSKEAGSSEADASVKFNIPSMLDQLNDAAKIDFNLKPGMIIGANNTNTSGKLEHSLQVDINLSKS